MNDPAYYNILIVQGDDFELTFTRNTKDCDTGDLVPVDMTAVSGASAFIYDTNASLLETFTAAVSDPAAGEVTISLTDTQTAALSGTSVSKPTETIGTYFVRLTWDSGLNETILRGKVSLLSVQGT